MKRIGRALFLLLAVASFARELSYAQPNIPRPTNPTDIAPEVREQIERLYSENAGERTKAADALRATGDTPFVEVIPDE